MYVNSELARFHAIQSDKRFPVFYEVDAEAHGVHVLAIGVKERSRLLIGGEEYES
jgi:hypothetical protein